MDTIILILNILVLLGLGVVYFLIKNQLSSYLKKKGENLAQKEDIQELTDIVEKVKSAIEKSHLIYEKEIKAYDDILIALYYMANAVVKLSQGISLADEEKRMTEMKIRVTEYTEAFNQLRSVIITSRPYYGNEIFEKAMEIIDFLKAHMFSYFKLVSSNNFDYAEWKKLNDEYENIEKMIDDVQEIIIKKISEYK